MAEKAAKEERDGVPLTNLDQALFADSGVTKRDLIDYLDAVADRMVAALAGRPLSVIRVHRGDEPFMQKNLPKSAPEWVESVTMWAESSKRDVTYALCNDRRTLLWFGNQRAVEFHPALMTVDAPQSPTHLVLDLDPPPDMPFASVVAVARLVEQALADAGLKGALKTSGAKGLHILVPLAEGTTGMAAANATRALAERAAALDPTIATTEFMKDARGGRIFVDATRALGATVVSVYSPRIRPGVPVSFPLPWAELDGVVPSEITMAAALERLGKGDPWRELMPEPQPLPEDLIAEGGAIPAPRAAAMQEGRRRRT